DLVKLRALTFPSIFFICVFMDAVDVLLILLMSYDTFLNSIQRFQLTGFILPWDALISLGADYASSKFVFEVLFLLYNPILLYYIEQYIFVDISIFCSL
ncbi:hypothetical protein ACJX0J_025083, partial [Zea mays]